MRPRHAKSPRDIGGVGFRHCHYGAASGGPRAEIQRRFAMNVVAMRRESEGNRVLCGQVEGGGRGFGSEVRVQELRAKLVDDRQASLRRVEDDMGAGGGGEIVRDGKSRPLGMEPFRFVQYENRRFANGGAGEREQRTDDEPAIQAEMRPEVSQDTPQTWQALLESFRSRHLRCWGALKPPRQIHSGKAEDTVDGLVPGG